MTDTKQYYPSNGTEGDAFMSYWCARCKRDPYSRSMKSKTCCRIVTRSMDGHHPKQWIYKDGNPTCTSFVSLKTRKQMVRKRKKRQQLELWSFAQMHYNEQES